MSKAEPVLLMILLSLILAALTVRILLGRYMAASMALLDCRLGYYGLLSLASNVRPSKMQENGEWISFNFPEGDFLFSRPSLAAHPMVVRRKIEIPGQARNVVTEGCPFGDKEAYKAAIANLPPAIRTVRIKVEVGSSK